MKSKKKPFVVIMSNGKGVRRKVKVKALDEPKAIDRAMKFYPDYVVVSAHEA